MTTHIMVLYCTLVRSQHWKKKLSHFDLKNWVTGGTKIRPGILNNWRIFESITRNNGSNLVPPVTHLLRSKWLEFFFQRRVITEIYQILFQLSSSHHKNIELIFSRQLKRKSLFFAFFIYSYNNPELLQKWITS